MGIFAFFKITKDDNTPETVNQIVRNDAPVNTTNALVPAIKFHEDIADLLWYADGPLKNINAGQSIKKMSKDGFTMTYSIPGMEEPSQIFTKLPIEIPEAFELVVTPGYYPDYCSLEPEQKGVYLKLLENPYRTDIDISYVFILYYGLERHLLLGNWQKAAQIIIKLRNCHKNKSFQQYSAEAIVLTAIYRKCGELAIQLISSLDTEHEISCFPIPLYLMCAASFNLKIKAKDLMRMGSWLGFDNTLYIKKYPGLFEKTLEEKMIEAKGRDYMLISDYLTAKEINSAPRYEFRIFANTSLREAKVTVVDLTKHEKLRSPVCYLLQQAHESVKKTTAQMRKNGEILSDQKPQKEKQIVKKRRTVKDFSDKEIMQYYDNTVKSSLCVPYSEYCECPGLNILDIIPKRVINSLAYTYNDIGYEKLNLPKSIIKRLVDLWGEPKQHSTLNELYQDVWHKYEIKYKKNNPF